MAAIHDVHHCEGAESCCPPRRHGPFRAGDSKPFATNLTYYYVCIVCGSYFTRVADKNLHLVYTGHNEWVEGWA
ncbi:hypothetical protein GGH91_004251 [Coemansia sp. RSA 2671]|nr:hypothetical protein LPJ60_004034 [Coemansia sp. RSA 2675]KAJ2019239.1 hypothetical protein IWW57_005133 [Coemansia sp. S610]KAJ2340174.1 hypothetical protein GGH91_004251 [Coemansia sp. RSA 2671]